MIKLPVANIDNRVLLNNIIRRKHRRNKQRCNNCGRGNTPECDTCDNYDNRALMDGIRSYVLDRYNFYETHKTNLNAITSEQRITGHTKNLLIDSYNNSADFSRARAEIFEGMPTAIKAKCPFCMISEPKTLDHYFDKDVFPEYAVYTPNLIPCCSVCNTKKWTHLFLPNGERRVLNYYFDEIPEYQFLFMTIELEDGIPIVHISLQLDDNNEIDRIIRNQFELLDLEKRYHNQLNDELSTTISELQSYYQQDQDIQSLIIMLNTRVRVNRRDNGINYWLACLYDYLASNPNMFERILQEVQIPI